MKNRWWRVWVMAAAFGLSACSSGSGTSGSAGAGGSGGNTGGSGGNTGGSGGNTGGSGGISPGSVQLSLELQGAETYCKQTDTCSAVSSIAIKDSTGQFLARFSGDCFVACETCEMLPCPGAACLEQGIAIQDETVTWDGTFYAASSCGQDVSCTAKNFAPAGQYIAVMCATPGDITLDANQNPQCTNTGAEQCVEVPFELPSSQTYVGKLP